MNITLNDKVCKQIAFIIKYSNSIGPLFTSKELITYAEDDYADHAYYIRDVPTKYLFNKLVKAKIVIPSGTVKKDSPGCPFLYKLNPIFFRDTPILTTEEKNLLQKITENQINHKELQISSLQLQVSQLKKRKSELEKLAPQSPISMV